MRHLALALLLAACSVPPETFTGLADGLAHDVAGDGSSVNATLTVSPPGALAFGDVVVGQTSAKSSVTLANGGSATTGMVTLVFDDPSLGFAVTDDMCSGQMLASGHTCSFSLALTPTTVGAAATGLRISATPGGEVVKPVTGNALTAGVVDIVDASHDFGSLNVDALPITYAFIVRNTGQATIGPPVPSLGGDLVSYTYSEDCSLHTAGLGPTDTCTVMVTFDPSTVGNKAGSLTVTSSGGGGADAASLSGVGTAHVSVAVVGGGLVTSSQPGINCGTSCMADFSSSPVTLTAQATLGSTFTAWTGDCTGNGSCLLDLAASKSVTATFTSTTYPLTVATSGSGSVSSMDGAINCGTNCSSAYAYDTLVTLTATPAGSAAFAGWSGDCGGSATCTVTMDHARSVTATFTNVTHVLAVAKAGSGSGTITADSGAINCGATCSGAYGEGATVVLTAVGDVGSGITGWTGCNQVSGDLKTCTVIMAADANVTATFAPGLYALTVATDGVGSVSSSDGNIACGASCMHTYGFMAPVSLNAVASGGAIFDHWSGGECNGSTASTCAFAMPGTPVSITAMFTYALTVTEQGNGTGTVSGGGIACLPTCTAALDPGTMVTLTATPTGGSVFVGWGGDCSGMAPCMLTMNQVHGVTATFSAGLQSLTVTTSGNGTGTVTSNPAGINCGAACTSTFAINSTVTLTQTATGGATFVGWSGDCTGTGACTVLMDRTRNVGATFSAGMQTLSVAAQGSGGGLITSTPAGISCGTTCAGSFVLNAMVVLHAAPNGNSTFAGWTGDCTNTTGDCTVTMSQARSVTAGFTLNTHQLNVAVNGTGSGTVTPNPLGTPCGVRCWNYPIGASVVLSAAGDSGSSFSSWSAPCSGAGTCTVVMNSDITETATFVVNYTLSVSTTGDGMGGVTSMPAAIACNTGATTGCSASYPSVPTASVTLTATASSGSVFSGWGGACAGSGTSSSCLVTIDQTESVTAAFTKLYSLTLTTSGTGTGMVLVSVSGGSAGPSCGLNCATYTSGSIVQLTATPSSGSTFSAWSGDCAGQGMTCSLTMSANHITDASFGALYQLAITDVGSGTVLSTDGTINCGTSCGASYAPSTVVTLNATPDPGSVFFGWSGGGCSGTATCMVTMSQAQNVTATFYFDLNLGTSGSGSISSGSGGVPCTPSAMFSSCTAYAPGSTVPVTATPATGNAFTGWSGACTGSAACSVTMSAPASVRASFAINHYNVNLNVTSTSAGQGSVSSSPAGITTCTGACTGSFDYNSSVTLTAAPDASKGRFVKWATGPCAGSSSAMCTFVIPANDVAITAIFDWYATLTLQMNQGAPALKTMATSSPASISCSDTTLLLGTCSAGFARSTMVTLTYSGTGSPNDWTSCSLGGQKQVDVIGSGDCSPGSVILGSSTCSITFTSPGAYTSEADVTCGAVSH